MWACSEAALAVLMEALEVAGALSFPFASAPSAWRPVEKEPGSKCSEASAAGGSGFKAGHEGGVHGI